MTLAPTLSLPKMNKLEAEIFELVKEIDPQALYRMGMDELRETVFVWSKENVDHALHKIRDLKATICQDSSNVELAKKYLSSRDTILEFPEPLGDIGVVTEVLSGHLIKEGIQPETYVKLIDKIIFSLNASLLRFEGKSFPTGVRILVQYQVLAANEILDIIEKESSNIVLKERIAKLRELVLTFGLRFQVNGFTDGQFEQVRSIMRAEGADLGRSNFYGTALKNGFDYHETSEELERKALSWIDEDLPKLKKASEGLSKQFGCNSDPESVNQKLKSRPGLGPEEALATTMRIRNVIQDFASESIVGINPKYETTVVETPPYLSPLIPTGAAMDFDTFTDHPSQRFYITTDPKRAPPGGFANLVNLLVHEEYGHCVHFSNTATHYAATPSMIEILPSLHGGATSEGLAFQRELEFLDALRRLNKKTSMPSPAEQAYIALTDEFGGFDQTLRELEFTTYEQRIIRFLRVVGDSRINSGRQDLLAFLEWGEKRTGLSQRTIFYQIFPAHEGIFPGYATCYAVVGQDIRNIQKPFRNDPEKLVKFNAYACSMGYPARSIYTKRLEKYAKNISLPRTRKRKNSRSKKRSPRNRRCSKKK